MSPRNRRLAAAGVVGAVLLVLLAASRPADPPVVSFRVVLGLKDKEPTDWSGKVAVADGEAVELKGWRFEEKDAIEGTTKWTCRTRDYIAPGERFPLDPASGKPKPPPQEPWPNGVVFTVRGAGPTVTLTLPAGEVKFTADDVPLGRPKTFLDGRVRVERLPAVSVLRPPAEPQGGGARAGRLPRLLGALQDRQTVLAWVAYQNEKDRVLLAERDGPDGDWSPPVEVAGPGDHFRVALASTHNDTLWVVWSSQRDHNWDLYGRPYTDGKLGDEVRLTDDAGAEPLAPHDHRPARPGVAGLAGRPRRQVRRLRPLRRRRRLARRRSASARSKADAWNPVVCSGL